MEDLLRFLITAIVEHPNDIDIRRDEADTAITFYVCAHQDDIGKIIGKGGKSIGAIRNIVRLLAVKQGKWVTIQVTES